MKSRSKVWMRSMHFARMSASIPAKASSRRISRGKMGQGERDSFFTSGTCAMGSAGEPFPDAILVAFHAERMPLAVVQRLSKEFLPAGVLHIGTDGVNLLLERPAQHLPFCRRPFVVHLHQTPNCL